MTVSGGSPTPTVRSKYTTKGWRFTAGYFFFHFFVGYCFWCVYICGMEIPKEHQLICEGCKKLLDMRDPSVLAHGWIENGEIVCYEESAIDYSSSQKVGDSVQWTADKKAIHLN